MVENNTECSKGGRPPGARAVRVLAARHAKDCVRVLAEVVDNEHASAEARVAASQTLLGYATAKTPRSAKHASEAEAA